MKPPLGQALAAFQQATGEAVEAVARVDFGRHDGLLLQSVEGDWYDFVDGRLSRISPEDDADLPLARELRTGAGREVLSWRPGRRIVLGDEARPYVFKGYRRGRGEEARRRHAAMLGCVPRDVLAFPDIIGFDRAGEYLVLERLQGGPPVLGPGVADVFYRLGHALRRIQGAETADLSVHARADELGVLDRWRTRVGAVDCPPTADWDAQRERLGMLAERVPARPLAVAHRDLHDGQLLVSCGRVGLIDFDLAALAETELDAANLTAHLSLRQLQGRPGAGYSTVEQIGEALLDGLDRPGDDALAALRLYQAASYLRLTLVYLIRPLWRHVAEPLLDLGRRTLDELEARCV